MLIRSIKSDLTINGKVKVSSYMQAYQPIQTRESSLLETGTSKAMQHALQRLIMKRIESNDVTDFFGNGANDKQELNSMQR
ncbi:hypothetical protein FGO68_gene5234 [Halteria grandinella]|uniref:Uncharacterized protein n=1 Tax=Halteria grandinella TaxID=5974 RepID=A0A8J8NND1_HALGN|nr:hypothetical protein FGO68_gene5234 [Halteria grandinella]